jgi:arsenate reductase-like glutaredoxin family protein
MLTIYTLPTCQKCKVIKTKLESKGIGYEECQDIERMKALDIFSTPALESDGKLMKNFSEINSYINSL